MIFNLSTIRKLREIKSREIKAFQKGVFQPEEAAGAATDGPLKGWTAIARYLGIPVATAHRWASEGMPVRREGRFTVADREAVSAWLGRESHMPKPAHVMTEDADMAAALEELIEAAREPEPIPTAPLALAWGPPAS